MENRNPMEYKPVFPLLMSMAIPPMISMLIQSLYNIIDSIFVSQLGEEALTAVSLIFPLQNLSLAISCGIGIAMNAFIARHLGAKDDKKASYYATQGIVMSLAHSLLFLIIGLFFIRPFLNMFTTNQNVIDYGMQYGMIVVSLVIGQFIHLAIEKMFQATGNMMMPMIMQIFGAVVNIVLDPILIFGYFGLPAFGVAGAAIATVIGQFSSASLAFILFRKYNTHLHISFKKFRVDLGIFDSPWVGFENFEFFFTTSDAWRVVRNTLGMNFLFILFTTVFSVLFAVMMYRLRGRRLVKTYQTITLMPSFLSWVVVGYMVYALLMPGPSGLINQIIMLFGGEPIDWYSQSGYWPVILLVVKLWHGVGYNSLFYYASLMGIDKEYFEAAQLDGATKSQELRYIILPFLKPIIIVMTLLNIGNIFRADFGLFFNVPRNVGALYPTTDVVDTYVYRALTQLGDVGMSAAVGLVQSLVGFVLILVTNLIVRKIDPESALF